MLRALALSVIVFSSALMHAQISDAGSGQSTSVKTPWFVDPAILPLANLIATPPAPGSAAAKSDLNDVHRVERTRTPSEVRAAQYDDTHEDLFSLRQCARFRVQQWPASAHGGALRSPSQRRWDCGQSAEATIWPSPSLQP